MTPEQKEILQWAKSVGGRFTKKDAVDALDKYYYNGAKHVGDRLSRMVNAGLLVREKPGVFSVGTGTKAKPATIDTNQTALFI